MTEIVEPAPAKINLTLRVNGRRADGYHEIESLVTFADLGERVHLTPAGLPRLLAAGNVAVEGLFAADITGPNLVDVAVARLGKAAGRSLELVTRLEKTLPVAAGLGGGSADAAAVLRGFRRLFPDLAALVDLGAIAGALGADVTACLASRPVMMTGIGQHLAPVQMPSLAVVLANARAFVPADKTRRVFEALSAPPLRTDGAFFRPTVGRLTRGDVLDLVRLVGNDLEPAALRVLPEIATVKATMIAERGCEVALLSGAGPTIVGVFQTISEAKAAAGSILSRHSDWWVRAAATIPA